MLNWIKDILGINEHSKSFRELKKTVELFSADLKRNKAILDKEVLEIKNKINFYSGELANVKDAVGAKYVIRKLEGYKNEHEYIELSMKIYILDNGCRKLNGPFVKSDVNGITDEYNDEVGPDAKMRCYIISKLVLPGYGNDERFDPNNEKFEDTFEYIFGKSYRELVSYMREFNYDRRANELCKLNFREI